MQHLHNLFVRVDSGLARLCVGGQIHTYKGRHKSICMYDNYIAPHLPPATVQEWTLLPAKHDHALS